MRRSISLRYLNPKGAFPSGNIRYYYRRGGRPEIKMPDFPPDHPEFLAQYAAAAKLFDDMPPIAAQHRTGTIGAGMDQRMAWLGHDSASEAERYGRSADVRKIISGEAPQPQRTAMEGKK